MSETPRRKIIEKLLKAYPTQPKKTLARMLRKKYPVEFRSIEDARTSLRYYTGAQGKQNRKTPSVIKQDIRKPCTLEIPKGVRQGKKPLRITTQGKWLITGDWHVPYHDEVAMDAMLRFAFDNKVDHLYVNGDAIDFYKSSQWVKDPRYRDLQAEINTLWEILDQIRGQFERKIYKIGNHEDRFTRRIWQATPELAVLRRFDVDRVLELKERDFEIVESTQHATLNRLRIFHGHELTKGFITPVNIARGLWLKTNSRALTSHWHRTSVHVEPASLGDNTYTCYSIGCMCNLNPDYAPITKWNCGFALCELSGSTYSVANYIVDRGAVYQAG